MSEKIIPNTQSKVGKAIEAFQREMARVRTGRASLVMLEDVRVDYYGQLVPLNQVATLAIPEARLITIAPWESNQISAIEKAIEKANIGVNPVNDGKIVRIPIPSLTEERRKELVKTIKHYAEETRVAIRHIRREILDEVKKIEKGGKMTEDDSKRISTQIQKVVDESVARVDEAVAKKEKEVMQV